VELSHLRVERIRQRLDAAKFAIELRARRHVAVLAVAMTLGGGAAIAALTGQVPREGAIGAAAAAAGIVLSQVRVLGGLLEEWRRIALGAAGDMEMLMLAEDEPDEDA
jgi:hypothetical protein